MDNQTQTQTQDQYAHLIGKTIQSIDTSSQNMFRVIFTDGTGYDVFAECGTSDYSIPFFDVHDVTQ